MGSCCKEERLVAYSSYVDTSQQNDSSSKDSEEQKEKQLQFGVSIIEGNDKATSFYTGLLRVLFSFMFICLSSTRLR